MVGGYLEETPEGGIQITEGDVSRELPLILCGPILRRTSPELVAVWVALKSPRKITLRVYEDDHEHTGRDLKLEGANNTVSVGKHLHITTVVASASQAENGLTNGQVYRYNLFFDPRDSQTGTSRNGLEATPGNGPDLFASGTFATGTEEASKKKAQETLTYSATTEGTPSLPSFILPSSNLNNVRFVHGSCRKPHGEGQDGFDAIHDMIAPTVNNPSNRPDLLYLTGDQIYADDVADSLMAALMEISTKIVWPESLPSAQSGAAEVQPGAPGLQPGRRASFVTDSVGYTGAYVDKPQYAKSHLLTAGEYYAMYLLSWSDVLWPPNLAPFKELYPTEFTEWTNDKEKYAEWLANRSLQLETVTSPPEIRHNKLRIQFEDEIRRLKLFRQSIGNTRRTLANIPTYMMFDDHEITDDWNLNGQWCKRVYTHPLGRRAVENGLLAYALFQAWGNTPERFQGGTVGEGILRAAASWTPGNGLSDRASLAPVLGLPLLQGNSVDFGEDTLGLFLKKNPEAIKWHYQIETPNFRVLTLDTRTQRAYRGGDINPPALLNGRGLTEQIPADSGSPVPVTLVVSPAPVVGVPFLESIQAGEVQSGKVEKIFDKDAEAWGLDTRAFEAFLGRLAAVGSIENGTRRHKVAFLSGDVHYSFTGRLQYWALRPYREPAPSIPSEAVFAQFTSSSFKNETSEMLGTKTLHQGLIGQLGKGYEIIRNALPDLISRFGWHHQEGQRLNVGTKSVLTPGARNIVSVPVIVRDDPVVIELSGRSMFTGDLGYQFTRQPDWRYRIDYILGNDEFRGRNIPEARMSRPISIQHPAAGNRPEALRQYLSMARNHRKFTEQWGSGKEIVGVNNASEITFEWNMGDLIAIEQFTWWRLIDENGNALPPFPLTRFRVPMGFSLPEYPQPAAGGE